MCDICMLSMWAGDNLTQSRRATTETGSELCFYSNSSGNSVFPHCLGSYLIVLFDWQVLNAVQVRERESVSHFNPQMQQNLCVNRVLLAGRGVNVCI